MHGRHLSPLVVPGTAYGGHSAQPRVFPLSVSLASSAQVELNGGQGFEWAGRTLLWDPSGSDVIGSLEYAVDSKSPDGNEYSQLQPGVTYDFVPGQFSKVYLRFTAAFAATVTGSSKIGRVIVAPSLYAAQTGASERVPVFVRQISLIPRMGSAIVGGGETVPWQATGGPAVAGNVCQQLFSIPGMTAAGTISGMRVLVTNTGPSSLWLSNTGTLTDSTSNIQRQLLIELPVGKSFQFETRPVPSTTLPANGTSLVPLFAYSADPAAAINWYTEQLL